MIRGYVAVLSPALAFCVFKGGGADLRTWNIFLLIVGSVSLAYWISNKQATYPSNRLRQLSPFLLPAYAALQLVPLPAPLVAAFSPGYRAILDALKGVGFSTALAPISVNSDATFAHLLRIVGYILVFFLTREFTARLSNGDRWLTALPLICIAGAEAFFGISQSVQGVDVEGTYANRNHFAGLLEMVLPFTAAGIIGLANKDAAQNRVLRLAKLASLSIFFLALLSALLDSQSKMGLISAIVGLLVTGTLWSLSSLQQWKRWVAVGCIVVACVFVLVFLPSDELVAHFGNVFTSTQNAGEGRWPIWLDTLRLIAAFPLFGCGLGTYGTAFLPYQTSVIDNTFTYAHNDYLQIFAEWGAIGFGILAISISPVILKSFRASALRNARGRCLACACAGAITAIAVHSAADFNLYIPANATVLAWILGIAASLHLGAPRLFPKSPARFVSVRTAALAISVLAILYASTRQLFGHEGASSAVGVSDPENALRRDPASPFRWCDLGDALAKSNRPNAAQQSFDAAVRFGPFVLPVLLRAASFQATHDRIGFAVTLTARVLSKTSTFDEAIFDWYAAHRIPLKNVLDNGLSGNSRASADYLNFSMSLLDFETASETWKWMLGQSYVSRPLARNYVEFLVHQRSYAEAATAWKEYLGPAGNNYLKTTFIYNGEFETEPSGPILDWEIQTRDHVEAGADSTVSHTGRKSLRVQFDGKENPDYQQVRQDAYASPGAYRFEAYVRPDNITTDEGIRFRILDPEVPARLDVLTNAVSGSHQWTSVTKDITVPQATRFIEIRVIRKPSLRFDSNISGTVWIDTVSLSKVAR